MNTFEQLQPSGTEYHFKGQTVSIPVKYIVTVAYLYMVIPIVIFFLTWLRWYVGIPATVILCSGLYIIAKGIKAGNSSILVIPTIPFFIGLVFLFLWVAYSGLGGLFFQTGDIHWRNAVFRDLIDYPWPVIYPETQNALCYYLVFWLVPALVGKVGGWAAANIALLIWGFIGIVLIYCLILKLVRPKKNWHMTLIVGLIIFWSGENLVGMVISNLFQICYYPITWGSFEGWLDFARNGYDCSYLYRSNIDALCQVYNQTIVPWLAICMILESPKIRNFAFVGLCALPYGPIPFIGLLPFFAVFGIIEVIGYAKKNLWRDVLFNVVSPQNLTASLTIFPVFWLFFKANVSFSTGADGSYFSLFVPVEAFDVPRVFTLLLFYLLEFGVYCLLIYPKYKRDPVFWVAIVALVLIPNFKIGSIRDFCMNASLPALLFLMILVAKYLIDEYQPTFTFSFGIRYIGLLLALGISMSTLLCDFVNKLVLMDEWGVFPYVADNVGTFSDKQIGDIDWLENYLVPNYGETAFFKYIAK